MGQTDGEEKVAASTGSVCGLFVEEPLRLYYVPMIGNTSGFGGIGDGNKTETFGQKGQDNERALDEAERVVGDDSVDMHDAESILLLMSQAVASLSSTNGHEGSARVIELSSDKKCQHESNGRG
jgi:hypothetical protein